MLHSSCSAVHLKPLVKEGWNYAANYRYCSVALLLIASGGSSDFLVAENEYVVEEVLVFAEVGPQACVYVG